MSMQMSMQMWGGSGGKPYLGMRQEMRLSPRMRSEPFSPTELEELFTITGVRATTTERDHHAEDQYIEAARSLS